MPATLLKKLLARNPFEKGLTENPEKRLSLKILSSNPIGVITTLFKKGLTENPGNNMVGVIKRLNGCIQDG
ncbi:hypothetical protein [Methanosarcina barkeri]|uniref:Uncharacterized protein n=1 Tax=Methanosarcina barkeri 227 TaxID=1434106 RepID=A0A0E3R5G3_METBA|nr:hypothetical protein [Methanosarcina barkeri]AKB58918.1 hypothetical protein MSBR2_2402 [Methanosarcina barkeri 227]